MTALLKGNTKKLNVQLSDGQIIEFMPEMVHSDLLALTSNQEIINRTESV